MYYLHRCIVHNKFFLISIIFVPSNWCFPVWSTAHIKAAQTFLVIYAYAFIFRLLPLMILEGVVSSVTPHPEWSPSVPTNTHAFKARRWHTIPAILFETIWNGSVEVSSSQDHDHGFIVCMLLPLFSPPLLPSDASLREESCNLLFFKTTFCLYCQAGLLGCEAVLSSMALMQANNIPGQKKMMSPLGQGQRTSPESHQTHSQHSQNHHSHQVHHGQPHHSHMGHPSTGSCPPLVRDASLFCMEK